MKPHQRLLQALRDIETRKWAHAYARPKSSFKTTAKGKVTIRKV